MGLSFENVSWIQQSLKKFINEQMQEGDLVAIVRTGSGIGALQSFTSDRRRLLAAVNKIRWNAHGRSGISVAQAIAQGTVKDALKGQKTVGGGGEEKQVTGLDEERELANQINATRSENFTTGTLGALSYIIRGMRKLPGRKSLMLFSEGFVLTSNVN